MSRVILWFWYLALIWCVSFCATSRLVLAAEESQEKADSERRLSYRITDFFLGSDDQAQIPTSVYRFSVE